MALPPQSPSKALSHYKSISQYQRILSVLQTVGCRYQSPDTGLFCSCHMYMKSFGHCDLFESSPPKLSKQASHENDTELINKVEALKRVKCRRCSHSADDHLKVLQDPFDEQEVLLVVMLANDMCRMRSYHEFEREPTAKRVYLQLYQLYHEMLYSVPRPEHAWPYSLDQHYKSPPFECPSIEFYIFNLVAYCAVKSSTISAASTNVACAQFFLERFDKWELPRLDSEFVTELSEADRALYEAFYELWLVYCFAPSINSYLKRFKPAHIFGLRLFKLILGAYKTFFRGHLDKISAELIDSAEMRSYGLESNHFDLFLDSLDMHLNLQNSTVVTTTNFINDEFICEYKLDVYNFYPFVKEPKVQFDELNIRMRQWDTSKANNQWLIQDFLQRISKGAKYDLINRAEIAPPSPSPKKLTNGSILEQMLRRPAVHCDKNFDRLNGDLLANCDLQLSNGHVEAEPFPSAALPIDPCNADESNQKSKPTKDDTSKTTRPKKVKKLKNQIVKFNLDMGEEGDWLTFSLGSLNENTNDDSFQSENKYTDTSASVHIDNPVRESYQNGSFADEDSDLDDISLVSSSSLSDNDLDSDSNMSSSRSNSRQLKFASKQKSQLNGKSPHSNTDFNPRRSSSPKDCSRVLNFSSTSPSNKSPRCNGKSSTQNGKRPFQTHLFNGEAKDEIVNGNSAFTNGGSNHRAASAIKSNKNGRRPTKNYKRISPNGIDPISPLKNKTNRAINNDESLSNLGQVSNAKKTKLSKLRCSRQVEKSSKTLNGSASNKRRTRASLHNGNSVDHDTSSDTIVVSGLSDDEGDNDEADESNSVKYKKKRKKEMNGRDRSISESSTNASDSNSEDEMTAFSDIKACLIQGENAETFHTKVWQGDEATKLKILLFLELQNVITNQLPNMGTAYINSLIFKPENRSIVLIKNRRVIGGFTFRPFVQAGFTEIIFCTIASREQVKGYGTIMMNLVKEYCVQLNIFKLITYADEYALEFFMKQGFTNQITVPKQLYNGQIILCSGAVLMECKVTPTFMCPSNYSTIYMNNLIDQCNDMDSEEELGKRKGSAKSPLKLNGISPSKRIRFEASTLVNGISTKDGKGFSYRTAEEFLTAFECQTGMFMVKNSNPRIERHYQYAVFYGRIRKLFNQKKHYRSYRMLYYDLMIMLRAYQYMFKKNSAVFKTAIRLERFVKKYMLDKFNLVEVL